MCVYVCVCVCVRVCDCEWCALFSQMAPKVVCDMVLTLVKEGFLQQVLGPALFQVSNRQQLETSLVPRFHPLASPPSSTPGLHPPASLLGSTPQLHSWAPPPQTLSRSVQKKYLGEWSLGTKLLINKFSIALSILFTLLSLHHPLSCPPPPPSSLPPPPLSLSPLSSLSS